MGVAVLLEGGILLARAAIFSYPGTVRRVLAPMPPKPSSMHVGWPGGAYYVTISIAQGIFYSEQTLVFSTQLRHSVVTVS